MGLKIYGIGAVESPDQVGEKIIIKNMDTSRLRYINDEHGESMFAMVGAILGHKKIFSPQDCENQRHLECWKEAKAPFLYVEGELADDQDHPNAQAAAALFRYCNQNPNIPLKIGFSVEGQAERNPGNKQELHKTYAEGVSLTVKPCHTSAKAFVEKNLIKSFQPTELPEQYKEALKKSTNYTPSFKEVPSKAEDEQLLEGLTKLKKSLNEFVDGMTNIQCKHCGHSVRFFKSTKQWPNGCSSCGNGYNMKQIYRALHKKD